MNPATTALFMNGEKGIVRRNKEFPTMEKSITTEASISNFHLKLFAASEQDSLAQSLRSE